MVMKKFNNVVFAVLLIVSAVVFVGCDSNVDNTEEAYVRFETGDGLRADGAGSRTIGAYEEDIYPADSLYWAYVAVKKSGLHTVGQSELTTDAESDGKIVAVDSDGDGTNENYILKEVGKGPSVGLNVPCGPFSYGDWFFKIFGYKGYDLEHRKFTDLVYTGETSKTLPRVNEPESGATSVAVTFALERATSTFWSNEKGRLVFSGLYFTVPQNLVLFSGAEVDVTVKEGTTTVASGKAIAAGDAVAGTRLPILFDTISQEEFTPGTHPLTFTMTYKAGSTAQEGATAPAITDTVTVNAVFKAGIVTVLYGNVDEIIVNTSGDAGVSFGAAVCKTPDGMLYSSLDEALATGKGNVTLIADIPNVGMVGHDGNIYTDGHYFGNFIQTSRGGAIHIIPGEGRDYIIGDSTIINSFASDSSNVWLDTVQGGMQITDPSASVYHSGTFDKVVIHSVLNNKTSSLGYHANLKLIEEIEVDSGFVEIAAGCNVGAVRVTATTTGKVGLRGTLSSTVKKLYHSKYSGVDLKAGVKDKTDRDPSDAYRMYTLNSFTATEKYFTRYGIEGMYVDLPRFAETGFTVPTRTVGGITSKIDFVLWHTSGDSSYALTTYAWDTDRIVAGTSGKTFDAHYGVILDANHYCMFVNTSVVATNYGVVQFNTSTKAFTGTSDISANNNASLAGNIIFYKGKTPVATDRYYLRCTGWVSGKWGLSGYDVPYAGTGGACYTDVTGDRLGDGKQNTTIIMNKCISLGWSHAQVSGTLWTQLKSLRETRGYSDIFMGSAREIYAKNGDFYTWSGKTWIVTSSPARSNTSLRVVNLYIFDSTKGNDGRGGSRAAAGDSLVYGTYFLRAF